MAAKDFARATHHDHLAQIQKLLAQHRSSGASKKCEEKASDASGGCKEKASDARKGRARLSEQEATQQNSLAIHIAMRLLALCCPIAMPKATQESVRALTEQYKDWCKQHHPLLQGTSSHDGIKSDGGDKSDDSDSTASEEEEEKQLAHEPAPEGPQPTGGGHVVDPFQVIADRAKQEAFLKKLMDGDGATVSAALGISEEVGASCAVDAESMNDGGYLGLFQAILNYKSTKCLADLFAPMRDFLKAAENDLPHGMQPTKSRHWTTGVKAPTEYRQLQQDFKAFRIAACAEERGRVSRMAGWDIAGMTPVEKTPVDTWAVKYESGACKPESFWIFHGSSKAARPLQPQFFHMESEVLCTTAVYGFVAAPGSESKKRKSYLQAEAVHARHVTTLAAILAKEVPAKGEGGGLLFCFGPSSPGRLIKLKKGVHDRLLQLEVQEHSQDPSGLTVALTPEAQIALHNERAKQATLAIEKLAKETEAGAKLRLQSKAIVAAPIEYVDDFEFNGLAFMHAPTTLKGQACVRTGFRYIAEIRATTLGLEVEHIPDNLMRAVPAYCHKNYYQQGFSKKVPLSSYR